MVSSLSWMTKVTDSCRSWPPLLTPLLKVPVSAVKVPVLSAWRSLDHVAGWEMGNELFRAKSQEQRGFKDTAAHRAQRKVSPH